MTEHTIPTIEENPTGLHRRYNVTKANGEPVDPGSIYFVARIDDGGDDHVHLEACRNAVRAYCQLIFRYGNAHPLAQMANEWWQLVNDIEAEAGG